MTLKKKNKLTSLLLLLTTTLLFGAILVRLDKYWFKENDEFNIRHILPGLAANIQWQIAPPSKEELDQIDTILNQPFTYLARGCHSFAFLSEDGRYVIKFHKYPSHMRVLPWVNRPFAYRFNPRRIKIKEYNFKKLDHHLSSYKNSYEKLQEETGVIYVHTAPTQFLNRSVFLIDKTGNRYEIPLDEVTFILQHKADLIYTTLDSLKKSQDIETSKKVVSAIIDLFVRCCQKGYIDEDPILRKNYGIIDGRAIHIDIGDMVYSEEMMQKENYIPHIKEMTESLRKRIVRDYPYLLKHYQETIEDLSSTQLN